MRKGISWLLLITATGGLLLAGRMHPQLLELRTRYALNQTRPLENMPPLVSFTTVALGGFRGIVADLLWIRVAELQRQGRFFEIVQLASWITRLEPRFPEVWAFHGWNMAYNISFMFSEPEDRWRWVKNGFELLRDEGLRYNPGSAQLLTELGWIFQHKISGTSDSAHLYYKKAWAFEMQELLGGPQPDYEAMPESTKKRLQDGYKMDPARMQRLDRDFGPLDWRTPQAQAIYWADRARESSKKWNIISADRMRYQSLLDAYRHGGLHLDRARDVFVLTADLDLVPRVRQAYLQAMQDRPDLPTVKESYHYFLEEGIGRLYVAGRRTEARQLFEELRERAPEKVEDRPFTEFAWNAFLAEEAAWNRTQPEEVLTELLYQSLLRSKLNEPQAGQALYTSAVELHARWKPLYPALPDLTETEHRAARHLRQTFPQLFE